MDAGSIITKLKALGYKENKVVYTGLRGVIKNSINKLFDDEEDTRDRDNEIKEKYHVLVKEPKVKVILENKYLLEFEDNSVNLLIGDKELGLLSLYHDIVYLHDERIVYNTKDEYAITYRYGHKFNHEVFMKDGICLMGRLGPVTDSHMYVLSSNKFYNVYRIDDDCDEEYEHPITPVSFSWAGTDRIKVHTIDGHYVLCALVEMREDDAKDFCVHKLVRLVE